ncbi:hypothetical protein JTE90_024547 [Oedothorax gibbosus]|uniref:Uncharacterized protein n=1 Tax=Oedothorax gibbosus TaxID=931172 RepID=A0AAV6VC21_9ARAC|nr:hypothetical protein JTE90_024547 [Oedothorax gibbosus]
MQMMPDILRWMPGVISIATNDARGNSIWDGLRNPNAAVVFEKQRHQFISPNAILQSITHPGLYLSYAILHNKQEKGSRIRKKREPLKEINYTAGIPLGERDSPSRNKPNNCWSKNPLGARAPGSLEMSSSRDGCKRFVSRLLVRGFSLTGNTRRGLFFVCLFLRMEEEDGKIWLWSNPRTVFLL